jgi:precorrin-6B methylase 2
MSDRLWNIGCFCGTLALVGAVVLSVLIFG